MDRPATIELEADSDAGRYAVRVSGVVDASIAPRVESEVDSAIRHRRWRRVTLDLRRTKFIDADGLRALLRLSARARDRGNCLRLLIPDGPSQVERVLTLTRTHRSLPIAQPADGS